MPVLRLREIVEPNTGQDAQIDAALLGRIGGPHRDMEAVAARLIELAMSGCSPAIRYVLNAVDGPLDLRPTQTERT